MDCKVIAEITSHRIMLCSQSAYTGGGMEMWMETLASQLELKGWDVIVALAKGKKFHQPEKYLRFHKHSNSIELDGTAGYRECRVDALIRAFRKWQPDIILPVGLADALYAASLWKKKGGKARLVTCLHSQSTRQLEDLKKCTGFIDLAVSVSSRGIDMLVKEIPEIASRTLHIPTGVPSPTVPRIEKSSDFLELAYVGRLDNNEKRVLDIVPLVDKLPVGKFKFHIVGLGEEENKLRSLLDDEVSNGSVIFHGLLSREELYSEIYPMIDALLIFSPAEGGPIVAWEAMIHGVIPVVSDFKGRLEEGVIKEQENALVFPVGDVEVAAKAVMSLYDVKVHKSLLTGKQSLPVTYTLEGFGENWNKRLGYCLGSNVTNSNSELPRMVSDGRFTQLSLGYKLSSMLRKIVRSNYEHEDAGGEWPSLYVSAI